MDSISPEVAEKIFVFFQYDDVNACSGQKKSCHHAGWSATHDAASSMQFSFHCQAKVQ
jgi:hypothetical protein